MFLVMLRSFVFMFCVFCFVFCATWSLGSRLCVIMSNKSKLITKPMIRDYKLCHGFLKFIECYCVCVFDQVNGFPCFGIFTRFHQYNHEHLIICRLEEYLCELNDTQDLPTLELVLLSPEAKSSTPYHLGNDLGILWIN